mmetsp:Transcript_58091/g.107280  ORF Transcript_58091/g.107280 Transcript_58091/m.107280 type:complete len:346 (+) Transcript_58091:74-1111(+)
MRWAAGTLLVTAICLHRAAAIALQSWLSDSGDGEGSNRFLLVSAPRTSEIAYVELRKDGSFANMRPQTLIHGGLHHPQGLAVDQRRQILYVTDPDSKRIVAYQLAVDRGSLRVVGSPVTISRRAESRWVAVDDAGNVFFSDEPDNMILKVPAPTLHDGQAGATTPEVVYSGLSLLQVSQPGGIAVDGLHVFWTNKHYGTKAGTVVKASERAHDSSIKDVSVLAMNAEKSYGICLAMHNIYFTDADTFLYGVKKSGGRVEQVSESFVKPRGCAWDGDGTVFVADRGANAVYALAGDMQELQHTSVQKVFHFQDAFGLAVLGRSSALARISSLCLLLVTAASLAVHW